MLVFGGSLQDRQLAMMNARPGGKSKNQDSPTGADSRRQAMMGGTPATSTMEMGSIDEEEPPPSPSNFRYADHSATATAKSVKALRRLNQQQVRLAKELERTRRRMKEEVSRVRTNTKKMRTVSGQNKELRGGDEDEEEEITMSIDKFTKSLGIDLTSFEDSALGHSRKKSDSSVGSHSTRNSKTKKTKKRKHNNPSAGFSTLPVLTTDGRGAFEVGAGMTTGASGAPGVPQVGIIPVFALPSVTSKSTFVNRIPREPRPEEIAARKREREEVLLMQQHLGLSESDLRDLEEELGMGRGRRSSVNEVDKFLHQQLEAGFGANDDAGEDDEENFEGRGTMKLNLSSVRKSPKKKRRGNGFFSSNAKEENEDDEFLNRSTPRCLALGVESNTNELRAELGNSIHSMQALTAAVKEDVIKIQKMCKIGPEHGKAGVYMKSWAVERVAAIMQDMLFSYVGSAFERWTTVVKTMKKEEKMTKYLRYQGTRKMELFLKEWLRKRIASGWIRWVDAVVRMGMVEREKLENKMALVLQNAWRGRLSRLMVQKIREQKRFKEEYEASVKIQAIARGVETRVNYHKILNERARQFAADMIQCGMRCYWARCECLRRVEARDRELAAGCIQRYMRGMFGRIKCRKIRHENKRNFDAREIQRCLRGRWGRKKFNQRKLDLKQAHACVVIQKHMRRCLAMTRCRKLREEQARELWKLEMAAVLVQKYYRGHRARTEVNMKMHSHRGIQRKRNAAATKIQAWNRGVEARIRVRAMLKDKIEFMITDSRLWQETWSEDANAWFYLNADSGEAIWEPPKGGYTKADGKLVLKSGKVIEDPLKAMTEEEKEAKEKETKCSDCEKEEATRFCNECGDKYCSTCYAQAHASGKRAEHTFARIGPIECEECGQQLAVKWCTQCDDPFCNDCFKKIHSRGKRKLHFFCNVDGHGNVSPRAWASDGQPAGVFSVDKMGVGGGPLGLGDDYSGMEGYGSEGASGERFGQVSEEGEWSVYYTDDGVPYWYSNITGESTFDDPNAPAEAAQAAQAPRVQQAEDLDPAPMPAQDQNASWLTNAAEEEVVGAGGAMPEGWEEYEDDEGTKYYYNAATGESTYDYPAGGEVGGGGDGGGGGGEIEGGGVAGSPWEVYYDEEGSPYYYNSETGDSTYDPPEGF